VVTAGGGRLNEGEVTFAERLKPLGYRSAVVGKWHLATTPSECGFDFASICKGNGAWYGRSFERNGEKVIAEGFVDDFIADESIGFIERSVAADAPFVLWMCTQVPHMDRKFEWPADPEFLDRYSRASLPTSALPEAAPRRSSMVTKIPKPFADTIATTMPRSSRWTPQSVDF
jgi:arylsulfatase A-like enzyme